MGHRRGHRLPQLGLNQLPTIVAPRPSSCSGAAYSHVPVRVKARPLLPTGESLFEAAIISQYLNDKFAAVGAGVGAATPEERARAALLTQVHDLYIASPNSSHPSVTANQGAMYKGVDQIDAASRAGKFRELHKQVGGVR